MLWVVPVLLRAQLSQENHPIEKEDFLFRVDHFINMSYFHFLPKIGVAILFAVFPAISTQAAAPLTLKATATEAPKKQAEDPPKVASPRPQGAFGVKQVDPLRKDETPQNTEKRPNIFQELLDRQVELPSKKRPPAPPKKTTSDTNPFNNPFEEAEEWGSSFGGGVSNPFEDAEIENPFEGGARNPFEDADDGENPFGDNPFGGNSINPSNPFAAGDPWADEDPRNQGSPQASKRSSANSGRDAKADEKEIRDCFNRYKKAVLNDRGKEAVECVDQKTIKYYEDVLEWTKSAKRQEVEQMSFMDKMMVLMLRHRIPQETVRLKSGKELIICGVENGMIGKDSVANLELEAITVNDDFASAKITINGRAAPINYRFAFENGQWKMNLTSILPPAGMAMKAIAQQQGMTDNDFIFFLLENVNGMKPTDSIWEPLQR